MDETRKVLDLLIALRPGDTISISLGQAVQHNSWRAASQRRWYGDNREKTISWVELHVNTALSRLKQDSTLSDALLAADRGLAVLQATYAGDADVQLRLARLRSDLGQATVIEPQAVLTPALGTKPDEPAVQWLPSQTIPTELEVAPEAVESDPPSGGTDDASQKESDAALAGSVGEAPLLDSREPSQPRPPGKLLCILNSVGEALELMLFGECECEST